MSDKLTGDQIIALAKEHYANMGLRKIDVPEWKASIYYRPITISERTSFLQVGGSRGHAAGRVAAIIGKALDVDGQPVFSLMHEHALLTGTYGPAVERVADILMAIRAPDPAPLENGETPEERAEKN